MPEWVPAVDLSNWQNLTPQGARSLAEAGVELVIVRASHERQSLIDTARRQMQMVVDAGMRLHAYGWMYGTEDPVVTAQKWLGLYDDQPIGRFWIDCEQGAPYIGSADQTVDWLHMALGILAGQWPTGIYTGCWWWVPFTGNDAGFTDQPLWDADYTNVPELHPARLYGGWQARAIHQYTGNGSLGGMSPLDLDAVDPALLGEDDDMAQMDEVKRIARDEIIRNIVGALEYKLPKGARLMLEAGALPAAQTLARGLEPGEGS